MKKTGFYIIKDKFFEDMSDPYLKGNKTGNIPPERLSRKKSHRYAIPISRLGKLTISRFY